MFLLMIKTNKYVNNTQKKKNKKKNKPDGTTNDVETIDFISVRGAYFAEILKLLVFC